MKIATRPKPGPPTDRIGRTVVPLILDDLGCCRAIIAASSTPAAWLALCDRPPLDADALAAQLALALEQEAAAMTARAAKLGEVATGRRLIAERESTGLVPASWHERLGELVGQLADFEVAWLESLWTLDDAAHAAALVEPAWVEVRPGERAIPADEQSWSRVARIVARENQQINDLGLPDALYDAWIAMDVGKTAEETTAKEAREKGRKAIRFVVEHFYGATE